MERFTWKIGLLLILVELIQGFELQNDLENVRCTGRALDLAFALDASSDVSAPYFLKQVNIVKHVVNNMDVGMGNDQVRIGAMTFGDRTRVNLHFSKSTDRNIVNSRINRMKQFGGSSNLANALKIMCGAMFGRRRGSRSDVNHMGIILTDGNIKIEAETRVAAKACQDSGVELFAIVIGREVTGTNLRDIVSQPDHTHLLHFANFDDSRRIGDYVIQRTCQAVLSSSSKVVPNKRSRRRKDETYLDEKVCNSSQPTDVMFMMNQNHLGQKNTNSLMKMVADVVEIFGTDGPFRIGTMFDECPMEQDIPIGSIINKTKLLNKIDDFQYGTPKSMIEQLRFDVFLHKQRSSRRREWHRVQRRARRLGLLFLDRDIKLDDPSIRIASRRALQRGIQLYAIVIGKGINLKQVERSIAPRERIISMPSYDALPASLPSILVNRLCLRRDNYITYNSFSH